MHRYGIWNNGTDEFIFRAAMEKQTKRKKSMDTGVGEEEEGEMYGKSNTEIYNTICKIDSQWEFAV